MKNSLTKARCLAISNDFECWAVVTEYKKVLGISPDIDLAMIAKASDPEAFDVVHCTEIRDITPYKFEETEE